MTRLQLDDTIAAIGTAAGEGAIGMVRLSGPESLAIGRRVFRRPGRDSAAWRSHRLYYGHVVDPQSGRAVDEAMLVYMRAPRTYTRQDVLEITGHGGGASVREILRLVVTAGARPAERGEITLRAFLSGRIDLAQAEAVLDAVRARTAGALSLAAGQLAGGLSRSVAAVRQRLIADLAHLEATIDFAEDDVPPLSPERLRASLQGATEGLARLLDTARAGQVHRDGVRVAIVGRPNAGKSSLLNSLLQQERAIVTPVPGTTRDVIEETLDLQGVPAVLLDTAGIVETKDVVERLGVARSREAVAGADVIVLVIDGSQPLRDEDAAVAALIRQRPEPGQAVVVVSKADLPAVVDDATAGALLPGAALARVSSTSREGLGALREAVRRVAVGGTALAHHEVVVSSARHREALERSSAALEDAQKALDAGRPADCLCTDLRVAIDALGQITGESVTGDILSQIFSRFCIGK